MGRRLKLDDAKKDQILEPRLAGKSNLDIAREVSVCRSLVVKAVRPALELGQVPRKRGRNRACDHPRAKATICISSLLPGNAFVASVSLPKLAAGRKQTSPSVTQHWSSTAGVRRVVPPGVLGGRQRVDVPVRHGTTANTASQTIDAGEALRCSLRARHRKERV